MLSLNFLDKSFVIFLECENLKFVPLVSCPTFITQPRNIGGIILLEISDCFLVSNLALLNVCLKLNISLNLLFIQVL
jgi:hypothetical protein